MKRDEINIRDPFVLVYDGAFYMFASFYTDGVGRGTHCLKAENPLGPFVPYSDGSITPKEWDSLDGPFLFRDKEGKLRMIWSSFAEGNQYCVALASPEHGEFKNDWKPERELLFTKDGGHGMIFMGLDGERYLALHSPNETLKERPFFYPIEV